MERQQPRGGEGIENIGPEGQKGRETLSTDEKLTRALEVLEEIRGTVWGFDSLESAKMRASAITDLVDGAFDELGAEYKDEV